MSFAVVYWLDVFIREENQNIMIESILFCQKEKGVQIYCWCIMPSHVHLIFKSENNNPTDVMRDFKTYTSKTIQKAIVEHPQERGKAWMFWMMERAGSKNSNIKHRQFWQQHNKPIELWSDKVIEQKINYIPLLARSCSSYGKK